MSATGAWLALVALNLSIFVSGHKSNASSTAPAWKPVVTLLRQDDAVRKDNAVRKVQDQKNLLLSFEDGQRLQANVEEMRAEVSALEQARHNMLEDFGKEAEEADSLYASAQRQLADSARNLRLAKVLCGRLKSCGECARAQICGWCAAEAKCVPGDHLGAYPGALTLSQTDVARTFNIQCGTYQFGTCDLACTLHSTCNDCVTNTGCGWCTSSAACLAGGNAGPTDGSCPGPKSWGGLAPNGWVPQGVATQCPPAV